MDQWAPAADLVGKIIGGVVAAGLSAWAAVQAKRTRSEIKPPTNGKENFRVYLDQQFDGVHRRIDRLQVEVFRVENRLEEHLLQQDATTRAPVKGNGANDRK